MNLEKFFHVPSDVTTIIVKMKGKTERKVVARRNRVECAFNWLKAYNPCYKDIEISLGRLSNLPENAVPSVRNTCRL